MQFYELWSLFTIKDGKVTEADLLPLIVTIAASDFIDASATDDDAVGDRWMR